MCIARTEIQIRVSYIHIVILLYHADEMGSRPIVHYFITKIHVTAYVNADSESSTPCIITCFIEAINLSLIPLLTHFKLCLPECRLDAPKFCFARTVCFA